MLGQLLFELAKVDKWLDDAVSQPYKDQPLAQDWARITKVSEELGEAVDEFILFTGQNPRKEQTFSIDPTLDELADTAITAILAMLHFTKDEARVGVILLNKVQAIVRRMVASQVASNRDTAKVGMMDSQLPPYAIPASPE